MNDKIAIVAIARDERPFIDEWLLYHHLIGADHIFVYDDDPVPNLRSFLGPHNNYATIVRWFETHPPQKRGHQQVAAYQHALTHFLPNFEWVAFIDIDEFIILEKHENLREFLNSLGNTSTVALHWHRFGHCGHYENPKGLVTAELTRRKLQPETGPGQTKHITRCDAIASINSVHHCNLKDGSSQTTSIAHINHYMCRSFEQWMSRPKRGRCGMTTGKTKRHSQRQETSHSSLPKKHPSNQWKLSAEGCLRKFVTDVSLDWNEHVDEEMLKYKPFLEQKLKTIQQVRESRK
jgi:hypothetical protein